jgi:uncharacterized membrane protein
MTTMAVILMSIGILASFAFIFAGVVQVRGKRDMRTRGWLMIAVGVVTMLNIYMFATMSRHGGIDRGSSVGVAEQLEPSGP